jgi:quercetin dioxygenase-like cupin family protein
MKRSTLNAVCLAAVFCAPVALRAQEDGLIALPNVYRVQFENDWVRVVRVNVPAGANLAPHSHPPGLMLHIYFNDADPILFRHAGAPYDITRPPVKTRSYRIGRATPETHAVINLSSTASDYMRVELKTQGTESPRRRVIAPPLGSESSSVVEVNGEQFRATRITVAAGQSTEVAATANEPALVIALTEGVAAEGTTKPAPIGQERFVATGQRSTFTNTGSAPIQILRIDFLTRPM